MNSKSDRSVCTSFSNKFHRRRLPAILVVSALVLLAGWLVDHWHRPARAAVTIQNSTPLTSVSAASYIGAPGALATNSIVAAFGTQLATGSAAATTEPGAPLPTSLLSTRVLVNNIPAPLFFVSAGQVNYLVPENTPAGDGEVVVTSTQPNGDQVVSRGIVRIAPTAPSIFTVEASGNGAPIAFVGRIGPTGAFAYDAAPPYRDDPANPGRLIPAPIDVGTTENPAYLILFGTGIRNASASAIRCLIGGLEIPVEYFGGVSKFAGLDQINLLLPPSLKGRGLVDVTIVVNGVSSNAVTIDLAGTTGRGLAISGFDATAPALAGETTTIRGNGFSLNPDENTVRFGPAQARVVAASASQLTVIVPFGAQSGQVTVQAKQLEARSIDVFKVRTSISGIIQSTGTASTPPSPLNNVTVRLAGTNTSVRTTPQGTFVLSDIPPGISLVEIDGTTNVSSPPFPSVTLKLAARADRDNQIAQPISLQQINGGNASFGGAIGPPSGSMMNFQRVQIMEALARRQGLAADDPRLKATPESSSQLSPLAKSVTVSNRGVSLEVPLGTSVRFPDGKLSGQVQLTVLEGTRLPGISMPVGVSPAAIAQVTPLGTRFQPGASLSFPNPDPNALGPGQRVPLYRYDPATGSFVRRGVGIVSADKSRIDSDGRVVDVASFWMVAIPTRTTTVTGRVVDSSGLPLSGVKVSVYGRASLTDQNGGFSINDVAAAGESRLQVEAIIPQQYGVPPSARSGSTPIVLGGITNVGIIPLKDTRQPGLVLSPFTIDMTPSSSVVPVSVTLTEPAPVGGLTISIQTDDPAVIKIPTTVNIPVGQTTTTFNVERVGPGAATIEARALFKNNNIVTSAVVSVALPGPTLSTISPALAPIGGRITISGTGLTAVPNNQFVSFFRNGALLTILNPFDNEIVTDGSGRPSLRVKVPALSPGPVTLAVSVIDPISGVISENSNSLALTISGQTIVAPTLSLALPGEGKPRDRVQIIGSGFSPVRSENQVFFTPSGLSGISVEGQVLEASATSITVAVPALGVSRGSLSITARRTASSGATSNESNSIGFLVTSDPPAPSTPTLTTVANVTNGTSSGKDGDRIVASGRDFGFNFFSSPAGLNTVDPIVTLVIFIQNKEFINFSVPINATGGNRLETVVPSGLRKGPATITVFNFDTETGLISDESAPLAFSVTEGSDFRVDEGEPNDSPDLATRVFFPVKVEGRIAPGDAGSLSVVFDSTTRIVLSDLFSLKLEQFVRGTISLNFNQGADLDLFVLRRNSQGRFEVFASSTSTEGTTESLTSDLPQGEYLIGLGTFKGSTTYLLSLQFANNLAVRPAPMRFGEVVEVGENDR